MSSPLERLLRQIETQPTWDALTKALSPTDLQSLLLEVYRERAARVTSASILAKYRENRFVQPSPLDPRTILEFDRLAYSLAEDFDPVELSPLCPLGTTSALSSVSQHNVVSTSRNTEVVADSTGVLALECAVRRARGDNRVSLCASHRLTRSQFFDQPNSWAHFRLFALCSAAKDLGNYDFEVFALQQQLSFYIRLLLGLRTSGYGIGAIRVAVTDFGEKRLDRLQRDVLDWITTHFDEVSSTFYPERTTGRGYYDEVCFHVYVKDRDGNEQFLVDGGFTDWTQQLLENRKERLLTSGIGSQRLCAIFAPSPEG